MIEFIQDISKVFYRKDGYDYTQLEGCIKDYDALTIHASIDLGRYNKRTMEKFREEYMRRMECVEYWEPEEINE